MTPGERDWLERMAAQWGERVAQMRRIACTRQSILDRAGGLEEVVNRLRARLDAAPLPAASEVSPPIPRSGSEPPALDFGRFQAEVDEARAGDSLWFMRSYRAGMIYSAAVNRRFGDHDIAARYERRADEAAGDWRASGRAQSTTFPELPMRPPPVAVPFTAGPQLDMFA